MADCIILIGFMGAGKSTVGKLLASRLQYEFLDTDELIKEKFKMSIPEIFEKFGEEYFRKGEKEVIKSIPLDTKAVIACGGGSVIDPDNVECLKKLGKIIYLKAKPETLAMRVSGNHDRPLLESDGQAVIDKIISLIEKREKIYSECCDESIDTDEYNAKKTVEILIGIV